METQKAFAQDEDGEEVLFHMYRSMIGSLMYLTSSRPDIMFAVCACARYQVNPKVSHLYAVKRIFRYLKGKPKLGLWYPKDSPFNLVAYTDSDYVGASLDGNSTTGGCQFLGNRLISWQCKKQTVVANSTTKAEYVAASSCCGQVLWIQNQLLDYRHNLLLLLKVNADRHKLTTAGERFEQIVDFLNAHTIKYALTINLTIYTSCIEQFWATVKAKTINGEVQLQALVDGKKIIITESIVRRDLQLEDADGVDCLPNATIFKQLTLMGYEKISQKLTFYKAFFSPQWKFLIHTILQCLSSKTTAWNECSSTMASAIICLATNQKFNFSKYIFESMVKNSDNVGKFLMYPRFVQVFVNQQLDGLPSHKRIYVTPSHTKKIFGNIKRVGKGFFADKADEEMDDSLVRDATTTSTLEAEQDNGIINTTQSKATRNEPSSPGTSSGGGPRCQETIGDTIAQTRVLDLETTKTTQATKIVRLKRRVKKLERRNKSRTHGLKRLYRVGSSRRVESFEDEGLGEEDASKQGRIAYIDANKDIYLVNVQTDEDTFDVNDLDGDEVIVESVDVVNTAEETRSVVEEVTAVTIPVSAATTTTTTNAITDVEITLAQALAELKSAKPKADKVVIQELEQGTTTPTLTTTTNATTITAVSTRPRAKGLVIHEQEQAPTPTVSLQQPSHVKVQDKGKGKMVELEPMKKMSKKELLWLDEEFAFKLQAEEEEE
ncbi:hypothetical protein Tco_0253126 [Tanacetum coccineum]